LKYDYNCILLQVLQIYKNIDAKHQLIYQLMHKKLAADLTSIAHSILQLKNKEDVLVLKEKAYEVYEKLTVLAYVDEYIHTTPNATETKEEIIKKIENVVKKVKEPTLEIVDDKQENEFTEVEPITKKVKKIVEEFAIDKEEKEEPSIKVAEEITEQPFDELEQTLFSAESVEEKSVTKDKKTITLEEELNDTISIEVAADLFEKPAIKKSLNDQ